MELLTDSVRAAVHPRMVAQTMTASFLRHRIEMAADAYKSATEPWRRIEAILTYAQAIKDLHDFKETESPTREHQ